MDEFFKAFKHFLARDLIFLVGGGSVLASFLYTFDRLPGVNDHLALYLLLAGISYVIGYAVQDTFCLLRVITTTAPRNLNRYWAGLYSLYTREEKWQDIQQNVDFGRAEDAISKGNEWQRAEFERIVSLQQVGSAVGPCALVSSGILFFRARVGLADDFALTLAIAAFIMGIILAHLAWIKAAQQARYLVRRDPGPKADA